MFKININNHPQFDTISRKAEMISLNFDKQANKIEMEVKIFHFIEGVPLSEYDRNIELLLSNKVNYPTGETDADGKPITIGDYDYFTAQAEAGVSLKDLVEGGIMQVQSTGVLNAKCAYDDVVIEEEI